MRSFAADVVQRLAFALLFAVLAGLIIPAAMAAQSPAVRGAIAGTVLDPVGAAASKVVVQARAADGTVHRGTTDGGGKYAMRDLPPGLYDVSVTIPGLRAYEQKGIRVEPGMTASVDIRLQEGTQLSTLGEDPAGIAADRARRNPPTGPTPRLADGKPDFSGVWWQPTVTDPGKPEWLPDAAKVSAQRVADNRKDSPQLRCLPSAVLRRGPLVEFVHSPAKIIEITDDDSPGFHHIYLNRDHPKEPDALWYGDSVGRWEGETLVVDRVNFRDEVWLTAEGHPHSDRLRVVERYRRPDLGHMEVEVTVEDPAVLARPWTLTRTMDLAPGEEIREFICENNNTLEHFVGR